MEGVKIEKHGITLSMPWEGKTIRLSVPMDEAIRLIGIGIGECNAWRLMKLLTLANEYHAELKEIYTKEKLFVVLDFQSSEELNEFSDVLSQQH